MLIYLEYMLPTGLAPAINAPEASTIGCVVLRSTRRVRSGVWPEDRGSRRG